MRAAEYATRRGMSMKLTKDGVSDDHRLGLAGGPSVLKPFSSPPLGLVIIIAAACALLASGCSSQSATQVTVSDASSGASPSAITSGEPSSTTSGISPSASPDVPQLTALDRLLPDSLVDDYVPSLGLTSTVSDMGTRASFPALQKLRPRDCGPLISLFTNPVPDAEGPISEWAWSDVYQGEYSMSTTQKLYVMDSEEVATSYFEEAVAVLEQCNDATGAWPQTGTIRLDDGLNYKRLSVGVVEEVSDDVFVLVDRPIYDGDVPFLSGIAHGGNVIVSLEMRPPTDMTAKRAQEVFTQHLQDALEFAVSGEEPTVASSGTQDATGSITLDCLTPSSVVTEIIDPYNTTLGPGYGYDIFVKAPITVSNACGKQVRSFQYSQSFSTKRNSDFSTGYGTSELKVADGKSRTTAANIGYVIYSIDKGYSIFSKVSPSDVTVETEITQVVFSDGTSLP